MLSHFHSAAQTGFHHPRRHRVAGVLHISTDAQLLARRHFIEPILPLNIIRFALSRAESRPLQS